MYLCSSVKKNKKRTSCVFFYYFIIVYTKSFYPLPFAISSAGRALAVFHTRQPTQRATSKATAIKIPT